MRIYSPADYQTRLRAAGFLVQAFRWTADLDNFGGSSNRFGLNREEKVYVARKF